ncbi:MAG: hypothetical protein J07HX64_01160 [halophilic archaeon J07HX64]|nr:MAG: hypothetical protein J07HX64_01160 [halophilic archaeon J07HX64]
MLAVAGGLITLVTFAAVVKMWRVISRDARERGISERAAEVWAFGVSYLAPLVAPVYLVWVVRSRRRETPMSTRDRWVVWLFCSLIVSFVASATLTHPGTFSQTLTYFAVFPPLALGVYVLLFWKRHLRSPEQPA